MLNVNWEKIHSIILSVTCHGLRNFTPAHTHPHELLKLYELLFFEFEFWPTPPHPYMTHPTPPHPYMTHPTLPHPFMTHATPPLYDTPHPTPPLHDPPHHPFMTHPTPPHPWYIFGHKGAFFHGLLHYVSLSVDNDSILSGKNWKHSWMSS